MQGRLYSYSDTHRHRLGTNYQQIPVNCPYAAKVRNYQRDGPQNVDDNQGTQVATCNKQTSWLKLQLFFSPNRGRSQLLPQQLQWPTGQQQLFGTVSAIHWRCWKIQLRWWWQFHPSWHFLARGEFLIMWVSQNPLPCCLLLYEDDTCSLFGKVWFP